MFRLKQWLMLLMAISFVVADDGAGGDFVIDEPETPEVAETPMEPETTPETPEVAETPTEPETTPESEEMAAIKAELEEMRAFREEQQNFMSEAQKKALVTEAVSELNQKYTDFDVDVIQAHLQEMVDSGDEKQIARAEMMNNPVGWELLHMQLSAEGNDGVFMAPRGVSKEPFDVAKASAKAEDGDEAAQMALLYGN